MKIYLARPITGESADEIFAYYSTMVNDFELMGYEVIYPMIAKGYLRTEKKLKSHGFHQPISTDKAIVNRDCWMVEQADIVLFDFRKSSIVSIGSVCELSWAYRMSKHTIVVMEQGNIHEHAFILHQADIVFDKLEDAWDYLEKLIKGEF